MAIAETRKKITWVPFSISKGPAKDTSVAPTVTITKGSLRFSKTLINELDLNGKFVRFFFDPIKKVVGWQIKTEVKLETVGKTWKMVRQNKQLGIWTISISKLLAQIDQNALTKMYYKLPVRKYVEANGMDKGQVYYFVELIDEVEQRNIYVEQRDVYDAGLERALEDITGTFV